MSNGHYNTLPGLCDLKEVWSIAEQLSSVSGVISTTMQITKRNDVYLSFFYRGNFRLLCLTVHIFKQWSITLTHTARFLFWSPWASFKKRFCAERITPGCPNYSHMEPQQRRSTKKTHRRVRRRQVGREKKERSVCRRRGNSLWHPESTYFAFYTQPTSFKCGSFK